MVNFIPLQCISTTKNNPYSAPINFFLLRAMFMDPYPTKYRNKIISIKVYKHFSREWRYPDFTPTSLNLFLSEYFTPGSRRAQYFLNGNDEFITCLLFMISLNIWISISNEIPTLTVQISVKPDPYSALDKPQKHTLRGRTSGRSFTLSAPPPPPRGLFLFTLPCWMLSCYSIHCFSKLKIV